MSLVCAIYTRKSSEEGLEQSFNSLDAQREASEAFILSQKAQGWKAAKAAYDDGGFSGGTLQRPALQRLLSDVAAGRVQIVVVYKVDRLTRSLADFAKLVELFDRHGVSFVSVTQQFNTTSSMGRLTLNVLLSFAQFEREVTGERIRDKIAASKRKGLWMGGIAPVGYLPHERTLVVDEPQAERVREIYRLYLALGCVSRLKAEIERLAWRTPARITLRAGAAGNRPFSRGHLYRILGNPIYAGRIAHKGQVFAGNHPALVDDAMWQAVQELLAANRQGQRSRGNAKTPSLLAGLVFDERGGRLTPSHAKKGERRYRYYISQDTEARDVMRLPAQELEDAVLQTVTSFLQDDGQVVDALGARDPGAVQLGLQQAKAFAGRLSESSSTRIEAMQALIERIDVGKTSMRILVRWEAVGGQAKVTVAVPVQLKRCGMAMRLIVSSPGMKSTRRVDAKLVALIARAQDWFVQLASGRCGSVSEVAQHAKVSASYVSRAMHLAFLAPDIVERIVSGEGPLELTADRLMRIGPLPVDWQAQRTLLGMV